VAHHLRRRLPHGARRLDQPPYQTYILYEVYITPGLMRHDPALQRHAELALHGLRPRDGLDARPAGEPPAARLPARGCKLVAGTLVSIVQVYASSLIAWLWRIEPPTIGYLAVLPALCSPA
jgi:ABC-2 type transport system permease protein